MISSAVVLLALLSGTFAANDWSTPCFDGVCSYENSAGTVKIWGSVNAISDITTAGGWTILNCDTAATVQDIRAVCHDQALCNHLYQSVGPVGKLVRLPEDCGANAFARVGRVWVHKDQSIPPSVAKMLKRRSKTRRAATSQVQGIALDTNFAAVDPAQSGNVSLAIQGSNVPGATGNLTVTPASQRRSRLAQRGLFDFIEDTFDKFNNFDKTVTKQLPPIDVDKTFPIFEKSLDCPASGNIPAFEASIKADVVTKAHAVVTLGIAATGTIVPPKLSSIGVFAGLDAQLDGTLELKGDASATADSGKLTLFETGIPGLEFPGILTLGPSFQIQGQAKATLDIGVDASVDLSYNIQGAKLFFPKSANHQSTGNFVPGDSPLKLSVTPSLASKGVVEAHLIPVINLGLNALDGAAKATVFLNLDASASVTLTLDAKAEASVQTNTADLVPSTGTNNTSTDGTDSDSSDSGAANGNSTADATADSSSTDSADDNSSTNSTTDDNNSTDSTTDDNSADPSDVDSGLGSADPSDTSADDGTSTPETTDDGDNALPDDDTASNGDAEFDPTTDSASDSSADPDTSSGDSDSGSDDSDFGSDDSQSDTESDDFANDSASDPGADPDTRVENSDSGSDDFDLGSDDQSSTGDFANDSDSESDDSQFDGSDPDVDDSDTGSDDGTSASDDSFFKARATTDASASVSGCVDVGAALSVNAGADASFFGLFDKNTQVSLFSKNFDLFKKCFGNDATRRDTTMAESVSLTKRVDISCPSANLANTVSLVD